MGDYKDKLEAFFRAYDEAKVGVVAGLLTKHAGKEDALMRALDGKYSCTFFQHLKEAEAILQQHEPAKVQSAATLLVKYKGNEAKVVDGLKKKYNAADASAAPSSAATPPTPSPASGGGGGGGAVAAGAAYDYKAGLGLFFSLYAPDKESSVEGLLTKHAGQEEKLCTALENKFGKPFFAAHKKAHAVFRKHAPANQGSVDTLFKNKCGAGASADQLVQALVKKYGDADAAAPQAPASSAASSPAAAASPVAAAAVPAAAAGPAMPPSDWAGRVKMFFEHHDAAKAANVAAYLQKYAGQEEAFFKQLVGKYGPEPYWLQRVERLFNAHKPDSVGSAKALLVKHCCQEEKLVEGLVKKLGPEPAAPAAAAPSPAASSGGGGGGTPATDNMTDRGRVLRFYFYKCPEKLDGAVQMTGEGGKYVGKEKAMYDSLLKKYGSDPSPGDPPAPTDYAARVVNLYAVYAGEKLAQVTELLKKYDGRGEQLVKSLITRYGAEPCTPGQAGGGGGAAPAAAPLTWKQRLEAFFQKYNADSVPKVDGLLEKYKGKEQSFIDALIKKFGPEPAPPAAAGGGGGGGGAAKKPKTPKERVVALFQKYEPAKVANADPLLAKYAGKEADLIQALVKKYGPEPVEEGGKSYEERMVAMFKRYNPEKADTVPSLLAKYGGREEELIAKLVEKYGPEPSDDDAANLPAPVRQLFESEAAARSDLVEEAAAQEAVLKKAEARKLNVASRRPEVATLAQEATKAVVRGAYTAWLALLKERIREEKRRHRALLDERMTIYEQLSTNKYSVQYYDMLQKRQTRHKQNQVKAFRHHESKTPPVQPSGPPRDFIQHNVRMASVSPNRRTKSPSQPRPTPQQRRRSPSATMSPAVRDRVLNYQRKWLPAEFENPDYPTAEPQHREGGGGGARGFSRRGRDAGASVREEHGDVRGLRAHAYGGGPPTEERLRADGVATLQAMTGASETELERAMRQRQWQSTSREVAEGQDAWDSLVEQAHSMSQYAPGHTPASVRSRSYEPPAYQQHVFDSSAYPPPDY